MLSLTKGLDPSTGERLSSLVAGRPVAVLSGPNIAEEVARGLPAAAVVACADLELAVRLQLALNSAIFRVYVNEDIVGVELCAAAKNVIALAAGGADGLGLGDNAKAALVSRGLRRCGGSRRQAHARTPSQGWRMGDLIVTCWSPAGRNRRAGELIAQGATAEEARAEIGMVVEGLTTAPVLRDLSRTLDIELPITEGVPCSRRCTHRPRGAAHAPRADDRIAQVPFRAMSAARSFSFTSESVTEGHPDKIADQISDSSSTRFSRTTRTRGSRARR